MTFREQVNLLCRLGWHRRSGRHVRRARNGYISRCSRCGIAMDCTMHGRWRVRRPKA